MRVERTVPDTSPCAHKTLVCADPEQRPLCVSAPLRENHPVRRGLLTGAAGTTAVATDISATRTGRKDSRLSGPIDPETTSAVAGLPPPARRSPPWLTNGQLLSPHVKRSDRHALPDTKLAHGQLGICVSPQPLLPLTPLDTITSSPHDTPSTRFG